MTIVREGERVILINSVRLSDEGLIELDKLGRVTDVIRLAGYHGSDDAFYKDRTGAKVWAIKGQRYANGFNANPEDTYFEPDEEIDAQTKLPISGSSVYIFSTKPPEALLLLEREGGVLVTGDCLQNWNRVDPYFSWVGGLMMRVMGFIKPHNVGPAWHKNSKPSAESMRGILDLPFDHVLPAHGAPVVGSAKASFQPAIEKAAQTRF
jgi:hypothetical protein